MTLVFNKTEKNKCNYNKHIEFKIRNPIWINHPDSSIDLSIFNIEPLIKKSNLAGKSIFFKAIDKSFIPIDSIWQTFSFLEEIIMFGYPRGIRDTFNNSPIARTGFTATQPKLDYQSKNEFLIDIAVYKGSSGSPIFLKRERLNKLRNNNIVNLSIKKEYYFVGVLYSGSCYNLKGEKIVFKTIDKLKTNSNSPKILINLGNVIKTTELLGFYSLIFD